MSWDIVICKVSSSFGDRETGRNLILKIILALHMSVNLHEMMMKREKCRLMSVCVRKSIATAAP
jgi:hypothetical protein